MTRRAAASSRRSSALSGSLRSTTYLSLSAVQRRKRQAAHAAAVDPPPLRSNHRRTTLPPGAASDCSVQRHASASDGAQSPPVGLPQRAPAVLCCAAGGELPRQRMPSSTDPAGVPFPSFLPSPCAAPVGAAHGGADGPVCERHAVVRLVDGRQAPQHVRRRLGRQRLHQDGLPPARERRLRLDLRGATVSRCAPPGE